MKISKTILWGIFIIGIVTGFSFFSDDPTDSRHKESTQKKSFINSGKLKSENQTDVNGMPEQTYGSPYYSDNFDGANDTNALKSRGYKVYYRGGGPQGTTATWFQGNSVVFPAYNGPSTGYVAANYNAVTATNNIDSWLVLPKKNTTAGDSLIFYSMSNLNSPYPDSLRVMYSPQGDSVPEAFTWVELGRFKVNTFGSWERRGFRALTSGASRFAIRYNVVNGGPTGVNSDYIGIDALTIESQSITNDMGTLSINSPATNIAIPSLTIAPKATFKNIGTATQTNIPVTFKITGPVNYTSNKIIPVLSPGVSTQVTFDSTFNPVVGAYNVSAYTRLISDGNRLNDTVKTTITCYDPNSGSGGGYYFSNTMATNAPTHPNVCWEDTTGSTDLILNRTVVDNSHFSGSADDGVFKYSYDGLDRFIRAFNVDQDSFFIGTNGIIAFNNFTPGSGNWSPPTGGIPGGNIKNAIYPLWIDLDFGDPDVPINRLSYKLTNTKLLVNYDRACLFGGGPGDYVSFQVQIELIPLDIIGNSRISIQYADTTGNKTGMSFINFYNNNSLASHLVGIQDSMALNAMTYRFRSTSSLLTAGPLYASYNQTLNLNFSYNSYNCDYSCAYQDPVYCIYDARTNGGSQCPPYNDRNHEDRVIFCVLCENTTRCNTYREIQIAGTNCKFVNVRLWDSDCIYCYYHDSKYEWVRNDNPDDSIGYVVPMNTPILKLSAFVEGLYNSFSNKMTEDTVKVYLRNTYQPYAIVDSGKSTLDSNGNGIFYFYHAANGVPYFIELKHRNSIETWSASGVTFASYLANYDFTNLSSLAYGNNMKQIDASPVKFGIYSGDVNRDGTIDAVDITSVFNDANNFVTGYVSTDLTGDNITDVSDLIITYNNAVNFVSVITPAGPGPAPHLQIDDNNSKTKQNMNNQKKTKKSGLQKEEGYKE